jgi:hypothetical protein
MLSMGLEQIGRQPSLMHVGELGLVIAAISSARLWTIAWTRFCKGPRCLPEHSTPDFL